MLQKLYAVVLSKREEIRGVLSLKSEIVGEREEILSEIWNEAEPRGGREVPAVDAGRNYLALRSGYFVVVNAAAMGPSPSGILADRYFVGPLIPPSDPDPRITNFDVILKTKVIMGLKEGPILVDGSLLSDLLKPRGWRPESWSRASTLVEELDTGHVYGSGILSQEEWYVEYCGDEDGREDLRCRTDLEFAEKFFLIGEVFRREGPTIYVSKRSDARDLAKYYCNERAEGSRSGTEDQEERCGSKPWMIDQQLLYILDPPAGYSNPVYPDTGKNQNVFTMKWLPKILKGEGFTSMYVRLHRRGPILRVEVPSSDVDPEEVFEIMSGRTYEGYPYWLARVDREVRVTRGEVEGLLSLLGLEYVGTGREMLL